MVAHAAVVRILDRWLNANCQQPRDAGIVLAIERWMEEYCSQLASPTSGKTSEQFVDQLREIMTNEWRKGVEMRNLYIDFGGPLVFDADTLARVFDSYVSLHKSPQPFPTRRMAMETGGQHSADIVTKKTCRYKSDGITQMAWLGVTSELPRFLFIASDVAAGKLSLEFFVLKDQRAQRLMGMLLKSCPADTGSYEKICHAYVDISFILITKAMTHARNVFLQGVSVDDLVLALVPSATLEDRGDGVIRYRLDRDYVFYARPQPTGAYDIGII
jgi:hypothetical protein